MLNRLRSSSCWFPPGGRRGRDTPTAALVERSRASTVDPANTLDAASDSWSWHALDIATALDRLGSSDSGVSAEAARLAFERHGPNELPRGKAEGLVVLFLRQLAQPLIYVLLAAAAVTAALAHWIDVGVILGVVIANAMIGVVHEYRAGRAIEALLDLVAQESTVVRNGVVQRIDARELVPGDVVVLDAGDKVPADCRLLGARGLFVDEALLTGESVPVEKLEAGTVPAETPLPERRNMTYAGTLVTAGQGRAVVAATAGATELGRISELVGAAEQLTTPLTRKITAFSRTLQRHSRGRASGHPTHCLPRPTRWPAAGSGC